MNRIRPLLLTLFVSALGVVCGQAGTISYVGIPSIQSDSNCGISRDHGYTTAIDGGNSRGTDRVVNGITLYALSGAGQTSATADNCTLNALSGTLTDSGLTSKNIPADGTVREFLSDMVFNNAGGENSQVEIVLDPQSLEQGSTYDLRVYICSSSGQNRQVNLAFFGDGQNAAETGFFNEDDARTSAGGFPTANQIYYINYRYTWDGDSTPGITITQKFGGAPFCLYALTNELVEEEPTAATGGGASVAAAGGSGGTQAAGGEQELSSGLVDQESDEVGVESDDFYQSESLNSHGRWVKLSKWGTCWQPTDVPNGWCPYANGSWKECDDCGWTFVSDEPWAWACYHYGRWCKVSLGCGWAWVPGTVWAPSWVSWRQGKEASCDCIGWAPLPPEAGCQVDVGISSWVDSTCNIGPECYTFIGIRDFGSDSYWGCGCIYERSRNVTIIIDTFNCTNICYGRHVNIYCGGPDYNWCNTRIRQLGGKECGKVYVNRYDNPGKLGGKFARHEGNQLGLVSPKIHGTRNPKFKPNIAESAGANKIDHGWKGITDKKREQLARNHIAQESKGKNPRNSPAKLPPDLAEKMNRHGGGMNGQGGGQMGQGGGQVAGGGLQPGGKGQPPGQGESFPGAQGGGAAAGGDQHPSKGRHKGQGPVAGGAAGGTGPSGQGSGFDQHPGKNHGRSQNKTGGGATGPGGGNQQTSTQGAGNGSGTGRRHPGQSSNKQKGTQTTAGGGESGTQGAGVGGGAGGGQHPGGHNKQQGAGSEQSGGEGTAGGNQGSGQSQGGGTHSGKGKHRQQGLGGTQAQGSGGEQPQSSGQGEQAGTGEGTGGGAGGKTRHRQHHVSGQGQGQGGAQTGAGGSGGGGGQGTTTHHKQTQQQSVQQGGGGGGQGQVHHQQQQQQQQGDGGQRHRGSPTPAPH
jgi:hypothetical protein